MRDRLAYHRNGIGCITKNVVANPNAHGHDEKHERPKVTLVGKLLARQLEYRNEFCENPALKCNSGYLELVRCHS
jgi:hypothetical protein